MKPAAIILTLLTFTSSIYAQSVSDGATNTMANTNTINGTVTVGTNGSFTLLVLSDNVLVTNSAHDAIGRNASERLILIQHADDESNLTYGIEVATISHRRSSGSALARTRQTAPAFSRLPIPTHRRFQCASIARCFCMFPINQKATTYE